MDSTSGWTCCSMERRKTTVVPVSHVDRARGGGNTRKAARGSDISSDLTMIVLWNFAIALSPKQGFWYHKKLNQLCTITRSRDGLCLEAAAVLCIHVHRQQLGPWYDCHMLILSCLPMFSGSDAFESVMCMKMCYVEYASMIRELWKCTVIAYSNIDLHVKINLTLILQSESLSPKSTFC